MSVLVACDLDGTLSFDSGPPSPAVMAALTALASGRDVRLAIATARSPRVVHEWFGPLARRLARVCCNGAIVGTPRRELHRRALAAPIVSELVSALDDRGERFCLEYGDRFIASHADALPWMGLRARAVIDRGTVPMQPGVVKVSIATGAEWLDELRALVGVGGCVIPHATGDADVVAPGVGKAAAVRRLGRYEALVAFGNDVNDLDLLQEADRAYVVGEGLAMLDEQAQVRRLAADPAQVAAALMAEARAVRRPLPVQAESAA